MSFFQTLINSIPGNIIHWFKFLEYGGSILEDSGIDNCGATLVGSPTWSSGPNGGSLIFNGTSQYCRFSSRRDIVNDCTLSAWIQTPASWRVGVIYPQIIAFRANDQDGIQLYLQEPNNGSLNKLAFICKGSAAWGSDFASATSVTSLNTIYHVAGVREGRLMKLYINGVLNKTTTGSASNITFNATAPNYIGVKGSTPIASAYWQGNISDVKIYPRALSASEILTLYNSAVMR